MALHIYEDQYKDYEKHRFYGHRGMYVVHKRPLMYRLGKWLMEKFGHRPKP